MTGKTHVAVGIASSLAIVQPKTIPEYLCAITGGMIGGMISDIDSQGKLQSMDYTEDPYGWQVYAFVVIALIIVLGIDYVSGDGVVDYVISNHKPLLFVGIIAFAGLCVFGATTSHRTFTHSIIAGVMFTLSIWCFCRPLAIPFAIGFASHLIIDFFNKQKTQYFWPFRIKFGLNLFPSAGRLNEVLGGIGVIASIYLGAYFFINGFAGSTLHTRLIEIFSQPITICGRIFPFIVPYLIAANVIGFVVYVVDYILYMCGMGFYDGSDRHANAMSDFIMTLLLAIDFCGGMIGKLIAVLVLTKGKVFKDEENGNINLFIIPICVLIIWLAFLCTFFFPSAIAWVKPLSELRVGNIPVRYIGLGYFLIINIITMLLFPLMQQFANIITPREKLCMILSLIGGATGGYLSMKTTGKNENATMLVYTLPEMMVMDAIVLACLFFIA